MSKELPQEVLVSPVVSLDDIADAARGVNLSPAPLHVISGPGRVTLYHGDSLAAWLAEHGYVKLANSDMCRSSEIDGWYSLSSELS